MRRNSVICLLLIFVLAACETADNANDTDDNASQSDSTPTEATDAGQTAEPEPTATLDPTETATTESASTPEASPATSPEATESEEGETSSTVSPQPGDCVDINTASQEELRQIIHIDEERSEEIIELRPFSEVEDLTRVNGIGGTRMDEILEDGTACVS